MGKEKTMCSNGEKSKEVVKVENTTPATVLDFAIQNNAPLEKIEKFMELKKIWEEREAKKAYIEAMTAFKKNPPEIVKDRKVAFKDVKYNYASLANVCDKINGALSQHGLSASWTTKQNGQIIVTCKITHILGHSEETGLSAPADTTGSKNAIQAIGSTISYLQRYTLLALCGLATEEMDDDGQSAGASYITQEQRNIIADLIIDKSVDEKIFLKFFGAESLDKIPSTSYDKAVKALQAKVKK
uniref:Putative Erf family protein n=1 Tax=viral metagenome TaxID=1070528 RepID=A0A6H1ZET2_9ZZZZ